MPEKEASIHRPRFGSAKPGMVMPQATGFAPVSPSSARASPSSVSRTPSRVISVHAPLRLASRRPERSISPTMYLEPPTSIHR